MQWQDILFDIEADGLGEYFIDKKKKAWLEATRIHCLVLRSYPDGASRLFVGDEIEEGWRILRSARTVIGHNIIQYDLPVLRRFYGGDVEGRVFDTLTAARLLWPDAKNHPHGGNSLAAFGKKLGVMKDDYTGGFEEYTEEMGSYCVQDCAVTHAIFDHLKPKLKRYKRALQIEHEVARICASMQDNGVRIDVTRAEARVEEFELIKARALQELQVVFPDKIVETTLKTAAYWYLPDPDLMSTECNRYRIKGDAPPKMRPLLKRGPNKIKRTSMPFNPGSGAQVCERFKEKYNWDAPLTEAGNPSCPEDVLKTLSFPEAALIQHLNMADKRLQHLADWVGRARNCRTPGIIHPFINTLGCATSRASHSQPNQTAPPKVLSNKDGILLGEAGRYGVEMRSLWGPPTPGRVQVGGDASGLELRLLGAALAPYDGGAYAREVVGGDIHTLNMQAGGLAYRDQAKTTIYAYLYGAGVAHIGFGICNHFALSAAEVQAYTVERLAWVESKRGQKKTRGRYAGDPYTEEDWYAIKGTEFRNQFEAKLPALAQLKAWCAQCASEKGFVPLLDGRHCPIRSEHSALNSFLQGNGAVLMKVAMIHLDRQIDLLKLRCGWMLWPHDEFQFEAHPDDAHALGQAICSSITRAGVLLKVACPMDGEYKVGTNWAETH